MLVDIQEVLKGERGWCMVEGDCLPILASLQDRCVAHVITDPPYDEHTHTSARSHATDGTLSKDLGIDFAPLAPSAYLPDLLRLSSRWVVSFSSFEMVRDYRDLAGAAWIRSGIYRRLNGTPQMSGDRPAQAGEAVPIMHRKGKKRWNGGGGQAYWESSVVHKGRVHPTQKPLSVMIRMVEQFTDEGDIILDPFAGSGTTGEAALLLGRRFIGIEMQTKYVKHCLRRLRDAERVRAETVAQASTFDLFMSDGVGEGSSLGLFME